MNTQEKILIWSTVIAALSVLVFFGPVSQKDIEKCQAATNYSAERCQVELGG